MNPEMFRKIRKLYLKAYEHSTALRKPALCLSRNGRAQGCVLFSVCFHRQNATLDFLIDYFFWSSASFSHWNCIWCDGKRVETICRKTCPRPTHIYQSIAGGPWDLLPLGVGYPYGMERSAVCPRNTKSHLVLNNWLTPSFSEQNDSAGFCISFHPGLRLLLTWKWGDSGVRFIEMNGTFPLVPTAIQQDHLLIVVHLSLWTVRPRCPTPRGVSRAWI